MDRTLKKSIIFYRADKIVCSFVISFENYCLEKLTLLICLLSLLYCADTSNKTKTTPSKILIITKLVIIEILEITTLHLFIIVFAKNDFLKINDTLGITKVSLIWQLYKPIMAISLAE